MEQFLNEALKTGQGIELGEALKVGGLVTGVGLSIVFGVLVILMIVLMLFKVIFYKGDSKKKTPVNNEQTPAQTEESVLTSNNMSNDVLIAVLTAAIAASLNTSTYNLKIKSYRRVDSQKSAWNRAGINETINNRF